MKYLLLIAVCASALAIPSAPLAASGGGHMLCGSAPCGGGGGNCQYLRDPFTGQWQWVC